MVKKFVLILDWVLEKVYHLMTIAAGLYPTTVPIGRETSLYHQAVCLTMWVCLLTVTWQSVSAFSGGHKGSQTALEEHAFQSIVRWCISPSLVTTSFLHSIRQQFSMALVLVGLSREYLLNNLTCRYTVALTQPISNWM